MSTRDARTIEDLGDHDTGARAAAPPLHALLSGIGWSTAAAVINKLAAAIGQLTLGWFLTAQDYANYGVAISATIFIAAFADGGVQKILRQQPDRFAWNLGPATVLSTLGSLISIAILGLLGQVSTVYAQPGVRPLVWLFALGLPLSIPLSTLRSRMHVDLRYRELAYLDTGVLLLRTVVTLICAVHDCGASSLLLGLIAGQLIEAALLAYLAGPLHSVVGSLTLRAFVDLFRQTRWTMLLAAGSVMIQRGDFFALGCVNPTAVGYYFFGFQLAASSLQLLTGSSSTVLLPFLARHPSTRTERNLSFERSIGWAAHVILPAGLFSAVLLPMVMRMLWGDRWDAAVVVVQAVALSSSIRGLGHLCMSAVEACGAWRLRVLLEWSEGLSLMLVVALFAPHSGEGLERLAFAVGLHRAVFGVIQLTVVGPMLGISCLDSWRWLRPQFVSFAGGAFVGLLIELTLPPTFAAVPRGLWELGAILVTWLTMLIWFAPAEMTVARRFLERRIRGPSGSALGLVPRLFPGAGLKRS